MDGQVGYKEHDGISTTTCYGYETAFHNLEAEEKGLVKPEVANVQLGIQINCGSFAYVKVPREFSFVCGLTGTFACYAKAEQQLLQSDFGIRGATRLPSLWGTNKRQFDKGKDFGVYASQDRHFQYIAEDIKTAVEGGCPAIAFFRDEDQMRAFAESGYGTPLGIDFMVTETETDVAGKVSVAVQKGKVSLWVRAFGRGLDFVNLDEDIDEAGGVLVVQAFFSATKSEEVQVSGRTARQGKHGRFRIRASVTDVKSELGKHGENVSEETTYDQLCTLRDAAAVDSVQVLSTQRDVACKRHAESRKFAEALLQLRGERGKEAVFKKLLALQ
eukprot:m.63673 g.63673  ORF g.63673 m.63673 type:complete len:330 (+) comp13489_c1_seq1:185-1174(+)